MKLKNKKTGEIKDIESLGHEKSLRDKYGPQITLSWNTEYENLGECRTYNSLAELNEEWEDYKEPKDHWFVQSNGIVKISQNLFGDTDYFEDMANEIGNLFETKEEAEQAVEKLKAWKRLKDKGFRFTGINDDEDSQELTTQCGILCEADIYHLEKDADFLLIFGGEE